MKYIHIEDAPNKLYKFTGALYNHKNDKTKCPICGGVGIPWLGWYTCTQSCGTIAVVMDGRTYTPIKGFLHKKFALMMIKIQGWIK